MSKINITEILDKHCKENHIEIYGNQLKAIKATMHEAIEAAIDKCVDNILIEMRDDSAPLSILKLSDSIFNIKNEIDYE